MAGSLLRRVRLACLWPRSRGMRISAAHTSLDTSANSIRRRALTLTVIQAFWSVRAAGAVSGFIMPTRARPTSAGRRSTGPSLRFIAKFFGELGQKVELTLALDRRSFFDTQWGSTAIYAFTDAEGHHFIWKTASWPDALTKVNEGDSIVLKGTIKEHNEYKGCKQTVLTRCKIVA